jgi:hypothetical protein
MPENIEIREVEFRADVEERTITGLAVPYGQEANIGTYMERFVPGAIKSIEDVKLFYGHEEPIGKVIDGRETEAGFEITAKISDTARGNEVHTLLRDGVLNKFSVGFVPVQSERDGNTVIRTEVSLKEVSVVPFPAFAGANITEVRSDSPEITNPEKETQMAENIELDVRAVQDEVAELRRIVEAGTPEAVVAVPQFRSAAQLLKAIARGDEDAMRAYTGATTADSYLADGWVGDLSRIVDSPAILRGVFSTGVLPAEGNNIEYASLDSNTVQVTVQDAEGDDLDYGKIEISSKTAPVKTIGGYIQLTRQLIERSSVAYLEHSLRAQALKVGQRLEAQMLAAYNTAHAAQVTAGNVVVLPDSTPTYNDWLNVITDAAVKFQTLGLQIDALVVDTATFKSLAALEGADGRPMLLVQGNGNVVGTISPRGLVGSLAGIPIVLDPALSSKNAFVSSQALRQYVSPVVQLQDENVINLSKDFSVYAYVATANEIPAAIVPVVVD